MTVQPTVEELDGVDSRIWNSIWDAERLSRYYGKISDRQQKFHQWLSMATIMLSVGGAITLLLSWPAWAVSLLFLTLTLVTASMLVFDFSRRAETARIASRQMRTVSATLKDLWTSRAAAEHNELSRKVGELEERMNVDTYVDLIVDDKINQECQEEAKRVIDAELSRA